MLRKTTFITILIYIYNSTYTISYVIGVRPVLVSIDHRSGEAVDNRTGGGGPDIEDSTAMKKRENDEIKKKRLR